MWRVDSGGPPPLWTKAKRSRYCFGYQGFFFDASALDESESDLLTNIKNNYNSYTEIMTPLTDCLFCL